jgi:hypothetical protein
VNDHLQKIFTNWLLPFIVLFFFALIIFILRGQFNLYGLSDAFLIPGVATLSIIILRLISRTGTYDIAGYGFNSFRDSFRRDGKKVFKSLNDYQDQKFKVRNNQSFSYFPTLIISILFILISLGLAYFSLN